jgi:TPR repeat protein
MKRLLTTLVILTGLIGSGGSVWADDFDKGYVAYKAGDYAEAAKWFRKAAEQGDADARYNLALMYDVGMGVTQDYAEAVKWYRKAAEQGVAEAQYNLGNRYFNGEGVLQDTIAAHMWFNIAAANGNTNAVKGRDIAAGKLSSPGVEEAQKRAKRCMASGYKDCD